MPETSVLTAVIGGIAGGLLTAIVTTVGWGVTHKQTLLREQRKDKLAYLSQQLAECYGPLHVYCEAGRISYFALLEKLGLPNGVFEEGKTPSQQAWQEWVIWMRNVFSPLNDKREEIILNKLHLINDERLPGEIPLFLKHIAQNRVILARWIQECPQTAETAQLNFAIPVVGDDNYAKEPYPSNLDVVVKKAFEDLKKQQIELLNYQYRTLSDRVGEWWANINNPKIEEVPR